MLGKGAAVAAVIGALAVAAPVPAAALDWSDTQIRNWWGPNFREPGIEKNNAKHTVSFTHADGYSLGSNFLNIDALISSNDDPNKRNTRGAREVYAVYRHDLSFNKVTGSKAFEFGPFRDLGFELGGDANYKDDTFSSRKRLAVAGLSADLALPCKCFWKVATLWEKEWNHNGFVGKNVTFDSNWRVESAWAVPLITEGAGMRLEGFAFLRGPKGKDGFGAETRTEFLFHPKLMSDVGALAGYPGHIDFGVGLEFWRNEFGVNDSKVVGAKRSTLFAELNYRF